MSRLVYARLLVLLLLLTTIAPASIRATTPEASPAAGTYDPDELLAIRPDQRADVASSLPAGLTRYEIDATLTVDGGTRQIVGTMRVEYTNTTREPLAELPFRLYANRDKKLVDVTDVTVDGAPATTAQSAHGTVLTVTLPTTLAPNDSTTLEIAFTTDVPTDDRANFGILNFDSSSESWSLAQWYPVVAGRDPKTGWMLAPTSINGDPVFTDTALYTVNVTAPSDLKLVTSGKETGQTSQASTTTTTYNAMPSRDFVIIADASLRSVERTLDDGTVVTSWYSDDTRASAEAVLSWTVNTLNTFEPLLGEYPYQHLQVAPAQMYNAAGCEYPQMVAIGASYYTSTPPTYVPHYFEFTVAHEIVHQWFYNLVGNNQYAAAFLDEGVVNYLSSKIYFEKVYSAETGDTAFSGFVREPFASRVEANADVIVAMDSDAFANQADYVMAAYVKAPMGFDAIHAAIGDEAFYGALHDYVASFRFRVASPDDLRAAFNARAATSVDQLWDHWFVRREGNLDIRD